MESQVLAGGNAEGNAAPAACWEVRHFYLIFFSSFFFSPISTCSLPISICSFKYTCAHIACTTHTHPLTPPHPLLSPILIHSSKLFSIFLISFSLHHTLIHSRLSPSLSFSLSLSLSLCLLPPPPLSRSIFAHASLSFIKRT